jgi:hypothetical protein
MAGGAALQILEEALHEDMNLEILLPASRGVFAGAPPEAQAGLRTWLQVQLGRIAQGTVDEDVRVRWLRGPVGRELVELAGPLEGTGFRDPEAGPAATDDATEQDPIDRQLLQLLTEGSTNAEMGTSLAFRGLAR